MATIWCNGFQLTMPDDEDEQPTPGHLAILNSTIELIPFRHLACLRLIEVRPRRGHPRRGGRDISTRTIRLNRNIFSSRENDPINQTFLHEFGHLVDSAYGVTNYVQRLHTEDSDALLHTSHTGDTGGAGERIADCYMHYIVNVVAGTPSTNRAYRGREGERRFRVLLESPAFVSAATVS
jgi:hypothetical protein